MKKMTENESLPPVLLLLPFLIPLLPVYLFFVYCRRNKKPGSFAFFHPYCDAGGGGERVLWRAIYTMQQRFPTLKFVVYTGDIGRSPGQILEKARSRFNISLQTDRLQFVYLHTRWLLEAKNYPRLTLLGQMFAGLVVGVEALERHCPEWFIDTTGCPLTLPLFRWLGGATTFSYVHYPTITTEMIQLVDSRTAAYNNSASIAASPLLTQCKLLYYRGIALLYRLCGQSCQLTMANGSWTAAHIADLWGCQPRVVFPPCDVERLVQLANRSEEQFASRESAVAAGDGKQRRPPPVLILSVGQIRPEKNHLEQLRIFAEVRRLLAERKSDINVKLVIAGGCRHPGDEKRVEFLKNYARGNFLMEPGQQVDWELNVPYARLLELMENSMVGLHTMWNEHFGISVVEGMAAGLIMVAHNSGGPKLDIIGGGAPAAEVRESEFDEPISTAATTTTTTIGDGNDHQPQQHQQQKQQHQSGQQQHQQREEEEWADTSTGAPSAAGGNEEVQIQDDDDDERCGFLATTREEYASAILRILLDCGAAERAQLRRAARRKATRFSDHNFDEHFCQAIAPFLTQQQQQRHRRHQEQQQ